MSVRSKYVVGLKEILLDELRWLAKLRVLNWKIMVLLLLLLLEDSANQKGKERKRGFLRSRAKVFMCKKRPERKQERKGKYRWMRPPPVIRLSRSQSSCRIFCQKSALLVSQIQPSRAQCSPLDRHKLQKKKEGCLCRLENRLRQVSVCF